MILAPHPDDETLGTGALIAHSAATGRLGGIVFLTDGSGSHPAGTPRLAATRRREAGHAIRKLGGGGVRLHWLGWRDAHPHESGSVAFVRSAKRLAALLRSSRINAIAVSDRTETHCDHVAAFELAEAAVRSARRSVTLFAYHVWSAHPASVRRVVTPVVAPGRRRHALRSHRSQMSPVLGNGFRLPSEKLRMPSSDTLTVRSLRR
ncbi:PIG-L family deacetylase [Sphingomonas naphthae]|uniref:PIG-L family deacetylase n=1 Tax=Sphingomonas naphthae TaxID=1813468 RepID=A0ABY7THH5_9SPHN|nr:PIG-L deacetylase family protein [Sphingomonas naphthae]WCT72682.1 PIG-L family deacetylase [Sphingomonas naphthae]